MKGLKILRDYIDYRHEAPAEDENGKGPANDIMNLPGKKFVFVKDDSPIEMIEELVSGAWHFEGMENEYPDDKQLKTYCRIARRIRDRWERLLKGLNRI